MSSTFSQNIQMRMWFSYAHRIGCFDIVKKIMLILSPCVVQHITLSSNLLWFTQLKQWEPHVSASQLLCVVRVRRRIRLNCFDKNQLLRNWGRCDDVMNGYFMRSHYTVAWAISKSNGSQLCSVISQRPNSYVVYHAACVRLKNLLVCSLWDRKLLNGGAKTAPYLYATKLS